MGLGVIAILIFWLTVVKSNDKLSFDINPLSWFREAGKDIDLLI